jgi:hypothetical protein
LVATPLGFLLSLIGVILKQDRRAGIIGLLLSGALVAYALLASLC